MNAERYISVPVNSKLRAFWRDSHGTDLTADCTRQAIAEMTGVPPTDVVSTADGKSFAVPVR